MALFADVSASIVPCGPRFSVSKCVSYKIEKGFSFLGDAESWLKQSVQTHLVPDMKKLIGSLKFEVGKRGIK